MNSDIRTRDRSVLIAEDDLSLSRMLSAMLKEKGFRPETADNGKKAWERLQADNAPRLVILDWMLPQLDGLDVCRKARSQQDSHYVYFIILTSRNTSEDVVQGLDAGADDYIIKPFNEQELYARIQVGTRMLDLQDKLRAQVRGLEEALANVRTLQGLLPICTYCKRIRNDRNYWEMVEQYLVEHTGARFSHSVCPECYETHVKPELKRLRKKAKEKQRS